MAETYMKALDDRRWHALRPHVHIQLRDEIESRPGSKNKNVTIYVNTGDGSGNTAETGQSRDIKQRCDALLEMIDRLEKRWKLVER